MLVLESIAATSYPNSFVHFDCPLDFMGYPGVTAEIVATDSPTLSRDHVAAIGLFALSGLRAGVPPTWGGVLEDSRNKPWRVDLYAPSNSVRIVREACARECPRVALGKSADAAGALSRWSCSTASSQPLAALPLLTTKGTL